MARRITRRGKAILSGGLHPHYAETVETVAGLQGIIVRAPVEPGHAEDLAALIDHELHDDSTMWSFESYEISAGTGHTPQVRLTLRHGNEQQSKQLLQHG